MELGIALKVHPISVHDGDTIKVLITREFSIRIRGVDTPELSTPEGKQVQKIIMDKVMNAKEVIAFIPSNDPVNLMDINSFNRIVGDLYLDGESLRSFIEKEGLLKNKKTP
jgi:endonuclease YncB( thermonuclease family)